MSHSHAAENALDYVLPSGCRRFFLLPPWVLVILICPLGIFFTLRVQGIYGSIRFTPALSSSTPTPMICGVSPEKWNSSRSTGTLSTKASPALPPSTIHHSTGFSRDHAPCQDVFSERLLNTSAMFPATIETNTSARTVFSSISFDNAHA